jgi:hypothetical protein
VGSLEVLSSNKMKISAWKGERKSDDRSRNINRKETRQAPKETRGRNKDTSDAGAR